jgi:hypothetical protein
MAGGKLGSAVGGRRPTGPCCATASRARCSASCCCEPCIGGAIGGTICAASCGRMCAAAICCTSICCAICCAKICCGLNCCCCCCCNGGANPGAMPGVIRATWDRVFAWAMCCRAISCMASASSAVTGPPIPGRGGGIWFAYPPCMIMPKLGAGATARPGKWQQWTERPARQPKK